MDDIPFGEAPLPTTEQYNELVRHLWGVSSGEPVLCEAVCRLAARWLEQLLQHTESMMKDLEALERSHTACDNANYGLHKRIEELDTEVQGLKEERAALNKDASVLQSKLKAAEGLVEVQARAIMENETGITNLVEEMTRLRNERDRLYADLDRAGIKEWSAA